MTNEEQIKERLEGVLVPALERSVVSLNMVREVTISDKTTRVTLASTGLIPGTQDWIKHKAKEAIETLPEINEAEIAFTEAKPADLNKVEHIIAVMSGKGGVGKSLVAGLTAVALKRQGYEVGILDADITGPSIPKMFGITAKPAGNESGILPVLSKSGIEIMSINLLLPNEDDAVIWRGPLIGKTITQFWEEVLWGRLDYLIVDLPPGTADASLTVMQTFPITGVIIVFTPQDLVEMIVRKAVNMARQMDKSVLGIVENMSYFVSPDTGKQIELFGSRKGQEMAKAIGAPLLAQFPIDPDLARLCDEGNIERYNSTVLDDLAEAFLQTIPAKVK